jgi:alginate O-acetyltransferase complex protein AlgI
MFGDIFGIFLLLFIIVINYFLGIYVAKFRETSFGNIILWLAIGINLGSLAYYKYDAEIVHFLNIILEPTSLSLSPVSWHPVPLGISFFTFTAIAYNIDVYREETEPQRNLMNFALFMSLFPKISAGPIVRYTEIANEITDRKLNLEQFAYGVKRFIFGLGKKVLIADTLGITADQIFEIPTQQLTASIGWLGIITYTLQIYFDFSGYTDMALGLGNMFGFKFTENFNYPYISKSLTEFWRRWHISLSTWLRDYLFIPLSHALMTERIRQRISKGKYKINYRAMFSIIIVFTLCGLWHGGKFTYLVWGMLHGIVLAIESTWLTKTMKKWWVPLQHVYLLFIIMVTWVFFRSPTLIDAGGYLKAMFGFSKTSSIYYALSMYSKTSFVLALFFAIFASLPIATWIRDIFNIEIYPRFIPTIEVIGLVLIIVMSFISIASSTYNPFIYRQF